MSDINNDIKSIPTETEVKRGTIEDFIEVDPYHDSKCEFWRQWRLLNELKLKELKKLERKYKETVETPKRLDLENKIRKVRKEFFELEISAGCQIGLKGLEIQKRVREKYGWDKLPWMK
jgi:hypothetical protein